MAQDTPNSNATYTGSFEPAAYDVAREILVADNERVRKNMKAEFSRRRNIVAIVALIWAIVSIVIALTNANMLLGVEIIWAIIVFASVFWMYPTIVGRANLDDIYEQYAAQLDKLERVQAPLPKPSCIEDLVAAIDFASEGMQNSAQ